MRKISLLLFIFTAILLLNACKEKPAEKPEETTSQINTDLPADLPDQGQTIQVEPQPVAAQPGEKLNPPHGEPGHSCRIPVGAPLSSDPGAANAQPAKTQNQQSGFSPSQVMPAQQTTSVPGQKLNPPHGEPGHDCKIPVGAPLK